MLTEYEITKSTHIILANKNSTIVYDHSGKSIINMNILKLLDDNCKNYGSSLKGRREGSEALTGIKYKVPIILSEYNKIVLFPTSSTRNVDCNWISLNNIKSYHKNGKNTVIVFNDDFRYEINVSYYVIENQIMKSAFLESKLYKNEGKK